MHTAEIGVIGGSGVYQVEELRVLEELSIDTPWGKPSDTVTVGSLGGVNVAFLPRHGRGHTILPTEVNSRANIFALKSLGVKQIVAFSASGSLKEEIAPLDFVIPSQIIDRTRARPATFFGDGVVAHVAFADPFCSRLRRILHETISGLGIKVHTEETVLCMEGPMFSTRAESQLYRSWGAGVINMSAVPEAKLAREAEICYAMVNMSTDYDCWHETEEDVTAEILIANMNRNSSNAKSVVKAMIPNLKGDRECECGIAARNSLITAKDKISSRTKDKLKRLYPEWF